MILVENILTSTSTKNALSSNMGRVLNESIQAMEIRVANIEGTLLDIQGMSSAEIQEIIG